MYFRRSNDENYVRPVRPVKNDRFVDVFVSGGRATFKHRHIYVIPIDGETINCTTYVDTAEK